MARRSSRYVFVEDRDRHPVRNFFLMIFAMLFVAATAVAVFNVASTSQVTLERQKVTVFDLPSDLENWSILHLSDLHGAMLGAAQNSVRRAISGVNVSSVVMTGDMLGPHGEVDALLQLVSLLPADKPKLLVLGDEDPDYLDPTAHGSLSPKADWAVKLEDAGVTILDEPVLFTRGQKNNARIWFVPEYLYDLDVDNLEQVYQAQLDRLRSKVSLTPDEAARKRVAEYQVARAQRIRACISEFRPNDVQVVLTHAPVTKQMMNDSLSSRSRNNTFSLHEASLILAGHYCGGQWRLPGMGAVYVPQMGWWPDDSQIMGLQYLGGVPQYISAGLGASGAYPNQPFRLLNPPQVTYIQLTGRIN